MTRVDCCARWYFERWNVQSTRRVSTTGDSLAHCHVKMHVPEYTRTYFCRAPSGHMDTRVAFTRDCQDCVTAQMQSQMETPASECSHTPYVAFTYVLRKSKEYQMQEETVSRECLSRPCGRPFMILHFIEYRTDAARI